MLNALAELAPAGISNRKSAQILQDAGRRSLEVEAQKKPPGLRKQIAGPGYPDHVTFSFIAIS